MLSTVVLLLADSVDEAVLKFDESSLLLLNALIGLMMFGMALGINTEDFKAITRTPKPAGIGLGAQFILLPFATFLLTLVLDLPASVELGMILVASCPGGNLSNVMTYLGGGNAPLSVGMTAVSTAAAVVMTPLNFSIWGRLNPVTQPILETVSLNPLTLFVTIVVILGIPLTLGILFARWKPQIAGRLEKPFKIFSVVVFIGFVAVALGNNWSNFITYIGFLIGIVALHNALALGLGFGSSSLARLDVRDRRAVTFEVGLQNSALALVLIFTFFDGLGGMALIAAWWGVWHIIAGLSLAGFWSRRPVAVPGEAVA
ncbi:MAG: bile acid:sodium symporter family protein [Actinomycetota bacterium]|nr:bile acid:sodium symporter family protein [Actinomycetota bacterium]